MCFAISLVLAQSYEVQAVAGTSVTGGVAVLRCSVPPAIRNDVRVIDWIQDFTGFTIQPSLHGGGFFYFLSPPKPQTMRVITIMVTFFILLSIALSCLVSGSMGSTRIDYQGVFSRRRETIVFQFVNHRKTAAVLVLCGNVEHKEAQDNDYHHTHTQRI